MARRKRHEEPSNHERWLVSYADFITLLFAFFVVMYSISSINEGKYRVLSETLTNAFVTPAQSLKPVQVGEQVRNLVPMAGEYAAPEPVPSEPEPEPEAAAESESQTTPSNMDEVRAQLDLALDDYIDQKLVNITRTDRGIEVEMKSKMLFRSGSASLSSSAYRALRSVAMILKRLPNRINVEGHTDNVPIKTVTFPSNWELSAARAASVVHLFAKLGVGSKRMAATGYGEHQPIDDNGSEAGRQSNRRVALVIMAGEPERKAGRIGRASEAGQ
ncbi:MAG: flagellar motor protein MotD [Gammaproteobacteria bacterium]|nr:flagellar motor protein MotD [Gammaproteobacteria bacterium]